MVTSDTVTLVDAHRRTSGFYLGRFLMGLFFMMTAVGLVGQFDKDTGGPAIQWLAPKLDQSLDSIERFAGFRPPIPKAVYPNILLATCTAYLFGSVLFLADVRFGACILLFTLSLTTLVMHNFWDYAKGEVQSAQAMQFLKNLAIAGGLIYYIAGAEPTKAAMKHPKAPPSEALKAAREQAKKDATASLPQPTAAEKKDG